MSKNTEPPKKCFCARCFLPVSDDDKVDIDGQNFHRICSMCCVCRTIPTSLKMFYGHVFCAECFKNHVLARFKGDSRVHSNSWWMQWGPGCCPDSFNGEKAETPKPEAPSQGDTPKRGCYCTRCLQQVEESDKVTIGGQAFHSQCAKCYFCQTVPSTCPKIYYGQVFCEECFQKHVLSVNKNPIEFFSQCFDQWQNNQAFSTSMREFMSSGSGPAPFIFMMQGQHPPFCRCGTEPQQEEWLQNNEPKKSAPTPDVTSLESFGNLTFENNTEADQADCEKFEDSTVAAAAQKIEKLTKYLNEVALAPSTQKAQWNYFMDSEKMSVLSEPFSGWVDLQDPRLLRLGLNCPMCLWQCGSIYVNSDFYKQKFCMTGDNSLNI